MPNFICVTCSTQYGESPTPPEKCPICNDQRQYVGPQGQQWTSPGKLRATHHITVGAEEAKLIGIGTAPEFAIGQRALLVLSEKGNVLWDCIPLIEDGIAAMIQGLGGLSAIAISHPHFYSSMVDWSRAFGSVPIYLHAADKKWVMRPDPAIQFWEGDTKVINEGLTLIRCGGHFDGGTVLHWRDGGEGREALLTGDIIAVTPDLHHVSFMFSYPDLIPLPAEKIQHIVQAVEPFAFERIYGGWWGRVIREDAKAAVVRSAERYLRAIGVKDDSANQNERTER